MERKNNIEGLVQQSKTPSSRQIPYPTIYSSPCLPPHHHPPLLNMSRPMYKNSFHPSKPPAAMRSQTICHHSHTPYTRCPSVLPRFLTFSCYMRRCLKGIERSFREFFELAALRTRLPSLPLPSTLQPPLIGSYFKYSASEIVNNLIQYSIAWNWE